MHLQNFVSYFSTSILLLLFPLWLNAQNVGINTSGSDPDASAMLDVVSTTKGMLIPRMTTTQRNAISSPATGLLVYDNTTTSFWFYSGSVWTELLAGNVTKLIDGDGDTKVDVEEAADEDIIRFDVAGSESWVMYGARMDQPNTNNTIIGQNAGDAITSGWSNIAFGWDALTNTTTGNRNVAIGGRVLNNQTTGGLNVAIGYRSMYFNTTGIGNIAIGEDAMYNANGASNNNNIAIGRWAQQVNNGANNISVGNSSLSGTSTSSIGIGHSTSAGNLTVSVGNGAGSAATNSVFLGANAGNSETNANRLYIDNSSTTTPLIYGEFDNNVLRTNGTLQINDPATTGYALPASDGTANQVLQTDGSGTITWASATNTDNQQTDVFQLNGKNLELSLQNDAVATQTVDLSSLASVLEDADLDTKIQVEESADEDIIRIDVAGTEQWKMVSNRIEAVNSASNLFIGTGSGNASAPNAGKTQGAYLTFVGDSSGYNNTTGTQTTAFGALALHSNTSGHYNVAFGAGALYSNSTASSNTAIGNFALYSNTSGAQNVALGESSMLANTTGGSNTAVGFAAMAANTTASDNVAVGWNALRNATTGGNNTAVGTWAMKAITSGTNNVGIGNSALNNNTTGIGNVAVGNGAGLTNVSGTGNVFLGNLAGGLETGSNKLYIDNSNVSTPLIWGDFNTDELTINGGLSIDRKAGTIGIAKLEVYGLTTSNDGPHVQYVTSADNYPVFHQLNWEHDNISLNFDAYFDGTNFKSSDAGSNFSIYKTSDRLNFNFESGVAQGGTVTWTTGMAFTNAGRLGIGTTAPSYQLTLGGTGNVMGVENQAVYAAKNSGGAYESFLWPRWADNVMYMNYGVGGFNIRNNTSTSTMFMTDGGNVGIGTTTPTNGKLEIDGSQNRAVVALDYFSAASGGILSYPGGGTGNYSIWATDRVAAFQFEAISDARIKDIKGLSNGAEDLTTLLNIEITNYQFIDKVAEGNETQKKVIAQQVKRVYPQAVNTNGTRCIPDIYQTCKIENGWVAIDTASALFKIGDRVKLITETQEAVYEVLEVNTSGFRVALEEMGQVFVYGREVNDFHTVDYQAISMLNVSATQELAKRLLAAESENVNLRQKVEQNSEQLHSFQTQLLLIQKELTPASNLVQLK